MVPAEHLTYTRECFLLETLRIGFRVTHIKPDGSRFTLITDICKSDGELAARVRADAAVFHLASRRIGPAPEAMLKLLRAALTEPG